MFNLSNDLDTYKFSEFCIQNMPMNKEREKNKAKIRQWLMEEQFKIQEVPDPQSLFKFVVENVVGLKMEIFQPNNIDDKIIFASNISVSDDRLAKLDRLGQEQLLEFLWDLRFKLIATDIGFVIQTPPKRILLNDVVYYDGVNKNIFMDKLNKMYSTIVYVLWIFDKKFGEPTPVLQGAKPPIETSYV